MTTMLKTIQTARSDSLKALSFAEIEAALNATMTNHELPTMGTVITKTMVDDANASAKLLAQLFIEYHLYRTEFKDALDFAKDYHDMTA